MDIRDINNYIKELEEDIFNFDNIQDLAYLYIIRNNFQKDNVTIELNDILPEYHKYIEVKKKYQLKQVTEEALIDAVKSVCKEIREFVLTIYNNTDMEKERKQIRFIIEDLSTEMLKK